MARGVGNFFSLHFLKFQKWPGALAQPSPAPALLDQFTRDQGPVARNEPYASSQAASCRPPLAKSGDPVHLLVRRGGVPLARLHLHSTARARPRRPLVQRRCTQPLVRASGDVAPPPAFRHRPASQEDKMNKKTRTMTSFFKPQSTDSVVTETGPSTRPSDDIPRVTAQLKPGDIEPDPGGSCCRWRSLGSSVSNQMVVGLASLRLPQLCSTST